MTYTLCLLALSAVFVARSLRIRARRRRERANTPAQLTPGESGPCDRYLVGA